MFQIEQSSFPMSPIAFPTSSMSVAPQGSTKEVIAEGYVSTVIGLYEELSGLANLDPAPEVNAILDRLATVCTETPDEIITNKVLTDPRIIKITPHLRQLCSEGECLLEAHWAKKIAILESEEEVNASLREFPYYSSYFDLIRMELYALFSMFPNSPRSFAFVGSGPIPLTSICIADALDTESNASLAPLRIHNIDCDQQAISLSSTICRKLGRRARSMTFQCTEATDETSGQNLETFDVVYLAALVGNTKTHKEEIINDISSRMRPGALLIMRSAHSLRSLLYPVIEAVTDLRNPNLEPLMAVHPYNHVVNSIFIARVTGA